MSTGAEVTVQTSGPGARGHGKPCPPLGEASAIFTASRPVRLAELDEFPDATGAPDGMILDSTTAAGQRVTGNPVGPAAGGG